MITGGSGGYLPPRKKPNNRKPLTGVLPSQRRASQTPKPPPPSSYTFVNAFENSSPNASTAAAAAVGQKRGAPTSLWTPLNSMGQPLSSGKLLGKSRPRTNFYRGLSDIIMPISGFDPSSLTSDFGPRTHPISGRYSNHTGVDFGVPGGTPVLAPANGKVIGAVEGDSVYGNQVILGHGRGKSTMYGHMNKFVVQPGQRVRAGDVIGYVGSTGLSTGNHLHWETWNGTQPVNPMVFLGGN